MKKIQYLIVFLLIIVIGMQGYYIYQDKKSSLVTLNSTKVTALKQLSQPTIKSSDLDKIFAGNPFEQMQKMQQNMQKIFNTMNSRFASMPEFEKFFKNNMSMSPALNFKNYKDRYELSVSIPGSEKNSIKIDIKNGILSIKANTKKLKNEKGSNFIKKEMYEGIFTRSINLPSNVNAGKMKTEYKNGVLKIILPKK
ncbi:MAG: Hsp20/alpha crystallin family protein [Campylobacteraceae bacterium]|nr:Hsp20/alpha crystallin family protein [Campylobacteraceae bacterium]